MDDKTRSISFAVKRAQAQTNVESHTQDILWDVAKQIVGASESYVSGGVLYNEGDFLKIAQSIASAAEGRIGAYVQAYSNASAKVLGLGNTSGIDSFLNSNVYGKTYMQRNSEYLSQFAEDVVKLCKAGVALGYDQNKLLNSVRTNYRSPFLSSVITKAQKQNIHTEIPHRGRGVYQASYDNIIRNVRNTVHMAWGVAELEYGKQNGAVGYYVHRGSSYMCAECDDEVGWLHDMSMMVVPIHPSCRCWVTFVTKEDLEKQNRK